MIALEYIVGEKYNSAYTWPQWEYLYTQYT